MEADSKMYSAIILSAGYSSRMGEFKPLMTIEGRTALEGLINQTIKAKFAEIIIVTGYQREKIEPVLKRYKAEGITLREVFNENFSQGMFGSIQKGIEEVTAEARGAFIIPTDIPLIDKEIIGEIVSVWKGESEQEKEENFIVPTFMGKKGHPLYIPKKYFEEIKSYEGTRGLKGITEPNSAKVKKVEIEREEILLDMDTKEQYEEIQKFVGAKRKRPSIQDLKKGKSFILVRHGTIEQHKEKIFLGQKDVELSKRGEKEMEALGEILAGISEKSAKMVTRRIYTSPLKRAKDSAAIIGEKLNVETIKEIEGFKEMSLGDWDGKYIREIKEKHPKEYEERGENLTSFKVGNGGENFFDLQYRVLKSLTNILTEEQGRDEVIVIVSHKGVIRAIESLLEGKDITEGWTELMCGQSRNLKY